MRKLFIIPAFLILLVSLAFTVPTGWKIANNHKIGFSTFGVSGTFKKFGGSIAFDEANLPASKFDVVIDVNSISTSFALQNKHAKGDEWFDAEKYPSIRFVSKKIGKLATGFQAIGDLQVHGVTKEVALPFTYTRKPNGSIFEGSFEINRNDFRVGEPGGMVGETIKVNVVVPVTK